MNVAFDMKNCFPGRVSILGAARSGIAVARFFIERNVKVFISDCCEKARLEKIINDNRLSAVTYESGSHTDAVLDSDLIVVSPGIVSDLLVLQKARERGIPVWSEMEVGFRASRAAFLAVTGSSGKSTTVSLAGSSLETAGIEHVVAGNIGLPVIGLAPSVSSSGYVVAEVSSFQLENIDLFRPKAAVILNLMKNHLDRYVSEEAYYAAKMEIARNMTTSDFLILNAKDQRLFEWGKSISGKTNVVYFGADVEDYDSFWLDGMVLTYRFDGRKGCIGNCTGMKLRGRHNYMNAAAAAAIAKVAGADDEAVFHGLCKFAGLPHRLEFVAEINGVGWYNDSKSTTAESIDCAVRSFSSGIHLIAGGKDKGCDFSAVRQVISEHVKSIILIGEAAGRMEKQWSGLAPIYLASTLEEAVESAARLALPGETVLLSPGCSSFDMFKDFEERGEKFRSLVNSLKMRATAV